jgi:hypothetical protein
MGRSQIVRESVRGAVKPSGRRTDLLQQHGKRIKFYPLSHAAHPSDSSRLWLVVTESRSKQAVRRAAGHVGASRCGGW